MPLSLNVNSDRNAQNNGRRFNRNANNRPSNAAPMVSELTIRHNGYIMKTYRNLYHIICSYENLQLAFQKARKRKTLKPYVIDFESKLDQHLKQLKYELETFTYSPASLRTFIFRDPKTRKISASHFRDRVVHHALCNVIEPILSKDFIYDSFANQKGKGAHKAVERVESFIRKVVYAGGRGRHLLFEKQSYVGYSLKADVRHYFDTVDQEILVRIITKMIKDPKVVWLIRVILQNHKLEISGKGMPIGNLTSQFFANVYLNELDHFIKHMIKAKYYVRYVDDFILLLVYID